MSEDSESRLEIIEDAYVKQDEQWRQQLDALEVGGECKLGDGWRWTRPAEGKYRERGITHDTPLMLVRTEAGKYLVRTEQQKGDKVVVWRSK